VRIELTNFAADLYTITLHGYELNHLINALDNTSTGGGSGQLQVILNLRSGWNKVKDGVR